MKNIARIQSVHCKLADESSVIAIERDSTKRPNKNKQYKVPLYGLASDLAVSCANEFFEEYNIDKSKIDFLIYCTEAPDYISPATSCLLQHRLGLSTSLGTIDLAFGCSGYTYGIGIAKGLVESGIASNVLFITSDIPTSVVHPSDEYIYTLFSDAASCTLINLNGGIGIGQPIFGTDGSGEYALRVMNSGMKQPKNGDWFEKYSDVGGMPIGRMEMDGEAVFRFSLEKVPSMVEEVLDANGMKINEIDFFIFHQASEIILKSLKRKLRIPDEKFLMNVNEIGNTVSASIPILLKQSEEKGLIKKNMKVLLAGFGVGFSWSGTVINY